MIKFNITSNLQTKNTYAQKQLYNIMAKYKNNLKLFICCIHICYLIRTKIYHIIYLFSIKQVNINVANDFG